MTSRWRPNEFSYFSPNFGSLCEFPFYHVSKTNLAALSLSVHSWRGNVGSCNHGWKGQILPRNNTLWKMTPNRSFSQFLLQSLLFKLHQVSDEYWISVDRFEKRFMNYINRFVCVRVYRLGLLWENFTELPFKRKLLLTGWCWRRLRRWRRRW